MRNAGYFYITAVLLPRTDPEGYAAAHPHCAAAPASAEADGELPNFDLGAFALLLTD